jgi:HK97 family phage portal protein
VLLFGSMKLLELLGVHVERPVSEYSELASLIVDSRLLTTASLSDRGVAAIAAAYRGAQLLEDMCAQLTWSSMRGTKRSDQARSVEPSRVDPTPPLLIDPSPFMSRDELIRTIVRHLVWRGRAPLYLQNLDDAGRPRWVTPINPDEVSAQWNKKKTQVIYKWRSELMTPGVDFHMIEFARLPGAAHGLGPFDAAAATLQGVENANGWARDLFADAGTPSGIIKVPGKLTRTEANALRNQWDEQHQGGRGTAVLSGGLEYSPVSLTPEQAQFIAARGFGIQEIARLLGIPQHFLNAGQIPGTSQSLTYTNVQAVFRELTSVTLYPTYLRRIEEAFSSFLPRGQHAVFDLSDFVQADDGTRYTAYKTAIDAGILTADEVRELEGIPNREVSTQ